MTRPLRVDPGPAGAALDEAITAFVGAAAELSDLDLLGASRCHGWSRLDVVTHVMAGLREMLQGFTSPVTDPPTVDAASYWSAFAEANASDDPVPGLLAQRRRSDVYARPSSGVRELTDVSESVRRAIVSAADDGAVLFQDLVMSLGDFLAIWAVELAVHHLDLDLESRPPVAALALTRQTVEALVDVALPDSWDDVTVALVGTGRRPVPADVDEFLRSGLPAFA